MAKELFHKVLEFLAKMGGIRESVGTKSWVHAELRGPDGELKQEEWVHNLVTDNGDKYCAELLYSAPTAMNDMKLGTANTAAAKSGAGSFIPAGSYITGSAHATDDSSPKVGDTPDEVNFIHTWAAGEATDATINEVAIVDNTTDAGEADATTTLARAVFSSNIEKQAADTLKVTWGITFLGA